MNIYDKRVFGGQVLNMGRNWRDTLDPTLLIDPPARPPASQGLLERIGLVFFAQNLF